MLNSESLLKKYEKKFINPEHERKPLRGTYFDGEGNAYATDGFQVLKINGLPADCSEWIRGLNGEPIVEPTTLFTSLMRIFKNEVELVATIDPKELLNAAKLIHGVQKEDLKKAEPKQRELNKVRLFGENGHMVVEYQGAEVIGSVTVGTCKDFNSHVNCKRLIDCLSVFEKEAEIQVYVNSTIAKATLLKFESDQASVILLPIMSR